MYTSDSYICFASKENGSCNVIIPLREVELIVSFQVLICLFSAVTWFIHKLLLDEREGCLCVSCLEDCLKFILGLIRTWVPRNMHGWVNEIVKIKHGQQNIPLQWLESDWSKTGALLPSQLQKCVQLDVGGGFSLDPVWQHKGILTWDPCLEVLNLSLHRQTLANLCVLCKPVGQWEKGEFWKEWWVAKFP